MFGEVLHSYVITDALIDNKVLKFKIDYNNVVPRFKDQESLSEEQLKEYEKEGKSLLLHDERITEISKQILKKFPYKTKRSRTGIGFNAIFAVSSVEADKKYYLKLNELNNLEQDEAKKIKIATIFSFVVNPVLENVDAKGTTADESFELSAMNATDRDFLAKAINDYNNMFEAKTNYSVEGRDFQDYYNNLTEQVRKRRVDLLIVVGIFLTGFDAPHLNTLFVDKNLRYHGLIQAFSRTNRIVNDLKPFGNIVTFRDLETATN